MDSNDFEDIFLDNEKTSFQNNFEEMTGDNNQNMMSSAEPYDHRPHAFPQNNFNMFSGMHYNQPPEWISRHKKLPGLSGFVTLGGAFENTEQIGNIPELQQMDIQGLVPQDFNFNLGKIFDENDNRQGLRRDSALDLGLEGIISLEGVPNLHRNAHRHHAGPKKHHKHSEKHHEEHVEQQENKMSFFKEYLPMLLEHHWREIVDNSQKFFEFEKEFDAQKHAENLMFLEEHKETYGNAFENIYHSHYGKIIGKLGEVVQSYTLTADTLLKIFYDDLCSLLSDLFMFMKDCTSDYCFGLLKNKTQNARNIRTTTQSQSSGMASEPVAANNNASFESNMREHIERGQAQQKQSMPLNEFVSPSLNWKAAQMEENKGERMQTETNRMENLATLAHLIDSNVGRREDNDSRPATGYSRGSDTINVAPSEIESVASENTRKLQRKYWSAAELQELENLSVQYHPHNIPIERLEEFARKYVRTLNAVQSKISKTKKEKAKKQSEALQVNIMLPEAANAQRKYEVSVEKMIKGALQQFPENTASKKEIIDKIKEMFFACGDLQANEEKLRNSISQTLSSSKSITKIKGTYGLRSRAFVITEISSAKTMKSRLQYIFSNIPSYHTDIATIRKLYWDYFYDTVDSDKVWETSIAKILKQSNEFDTSNCKTKYCLIGPERQG